MLSNGWAPLTDSALRLHGPARAQDLGHPADQAAECLRFPGAAANAPRSQVRRGGLRQDCPRGYETTKELDQTFPALAVALLRPPGPPGGIKVPAGVQNGLVLGFRVEGSQPLGLRRAQQAMVG